MKRRLSVLVITFGILMSGIQSAESVPVFEEIFDALDATRWSVQANGYTGAAVSVPAGRRHTGQPGGVSFPDFPYVSSLINPFPLTGDFPPGLGIQYTGITGKGSGLGVPGADNVPPGNDFRGDANPGAISNLSFHTLEYQVVGTRVTELFDSVVVGSFTLPTRPAALLPAIGRMPATNGGGIVDANGVVTGRWWGSGPWPAFKPDFVRITDLPPTPFPVSNPEPSAYSLSGSGLVVGVIIWKRRFCMN